MLLQNNCINNGAAYGLEQKKKSMQNSFIWYNRGEGRDRDEWLIGVHAQNIPYLSTVTTQNA